MSLELIWNAKSYGFQGRRLPLPDPGTYDAQHHTPWTHHIFRVVMWDNGNWALYLNDALVRTGEWFDVGRNSKAAKEIATKYAKELLNYDD